MRALFYSILFLFLTTAIGVSPQLWAQGKDKMSDATEDKVSFFEEKNLDANFFKNDTSLGGILTTGNIEQITVEGRSLTVYRVKRFRNEWRIGGYYDRKFFDSDDPLDPAETNARYIYGTYRLDYFLTQYTTFFFGGGGYSDQIKGIPLGGTGFTGISHYFIWTERTALNLAGGYQFVGERRDPPDPKRIMHTAKVELTFQQKISDSVSFFFNVDSLKDITDLNEWLINGDVRFQVKLYKILSLNVGFTVRFDNVPTTGFRKVDTITSLGLGVTFQSPSAKNKAEAEAAVKESK